jgi:hypothetical protein
MAFSAVPSKLRYGLSFLMAMGSSYLRTTVETVALMLEKPRGLRNSRSEGSHPSESVTGDVFY